MNDFTKEELQILHLELNIKIKKERVLKIAESIIDLRDKIEFMIDNYCEHELISTKGSYFTCKKCGMID